MDESERLARRQRRERLRNEHPQLFSELTAILARHDPVDLVSIGAPEDEYEPEVGTILPRLREAKSVADVQHILCDEFDQWFGASTPKMTREDFLPVAEEVWAAWRRHYAGLDPVEELGEA